VFSVVVCYSQPAHVKNKEETWVQKLLAQNATTSTSKLEVLTLRGFVNFFPGFSTPLHNGVGGTKNVAKPLSEESDTKQLLDLTYEMGNAGRTVAAGIE
jgi:hypothetical protein